MRPLKRSDHVFGSVFARLRVGGGGLSCAPRHGWARPLGSPSSFLLSVTVLPRSLPTRGWAVAVLLRVLSFCRPPPRFWVGRCRGCGLDVLIRVRCLGLRGEWLARVEELRLPRLLSLKKIDTFDPGRYSLCVLSRLILFSWCCPVSQLTDLTSDAWERSA